jgi:hypothetical protein
VGSKDGVGVVEKYLLPAGIGRANRLIQCRSQYTDWEAPAGGENNIKMGLRKMLCVWGGH